VQGGRKAGSSLPDVFDELDRWEKVLASRPYFCGDRMTEAYWCHFPTLVRFDPVYHGHFECNLRRIIDHSNLWGYLRDLYQQPGVAGTVNMDHIKGTTTGAARASIRPA
jgi:putative glutathione S-transferase